MAYGGSPELKINPGQLYDQLQKIQLQCHESTEAVGITSTGRAVSALTYQQLSDEEKQGSSFLECQKRLSEKLRKFQSAAVLESRKITPEEVSSSPTLQSSIEIVQALLPKKPAAEVARSTQAILILDSARYFLREGNKKNAFQELEDLIRTIKREDSPEEYDEAVLKMAEIYGPKTAGGFDVKVLLTHLETSARSGNQQAVQEYRKLKATAQKKTDQWAPTHLGESSIRWTGFNTKGKDRFEARTQASFTDEMKERLKAYNHKRSTEQLNHLDYRAEPSPEKVRLKLKKAREKADWHQGIKREKFKRRKNFKTFPESLDPFNVPPEPVIHTSAPSRFTNLGIASCISRKPRMEDAHLADTFSLQCGDKTIPIAITGVFDGHTSSGDGSLASNYAARNITRYLAKRLAEFNPTGELTEVGIWNALKLALVDLSRDPFYYQKETYNTGTTANISLVIGDHLWVVNTGDSRAILLKEDGSCLQLSEDAKAYIENNDYLTSEKSEYGVSGEKRGGYFDPVDGRLRSPNRMVSLGTARSVGDVNMGGAASARPKITCFALSELQGGTLIQCCDGVFDIASSDQVAERVFENRKLGDFTSKDLAEDIVQASYYTGSKDNLTALVIPVHSMVEALKAQ
ncbi:PP2C family serine/threonine-protein phosphatase [Endozoicomonas arenosclerae]|uniref:PP2C family serine/threonine-protein phosphatase n=1 Tax=Endozoicomonas arenosclerae TaxID=1633495 RepID=UPI000781CEDC|nr:PP2C family protein-serine/threonine phosphatase [Endozoicomonas arenosclerae]